MDERQYISCIQGTLFIKHRGNPVWSTYFVPWLMLDSYMGKLCLRFLVGDEVCIAVLPERMEFRALPSGRDRVVNYAGV